MLKGEPNTAEHCRTLPKHEQNIRKTPRSLASVDRNERVVNWNSELFPLHSRFLGQRVSWCGSLDRETIKVMRPRHKKKTYAGTECGTMRTRDPLEVKAKTEVYV